MHVIDEERSTKTVIVTSHFIKLINKALLTPRYKINHN